MAESSNKAGESTKRWPSLHEPDDRIEQSAESWAHAPSREVTGDVPGSVNAEIEHDRRIEENAPGQPGTLDALVAREATDEQDQLEARDDEPTVADRADEETARARRRGDH
jgi:hypothetical protein